MSATRRAAQRMTMAWVLALVIMTAGALSPASAAPLKLDACLSLWRQTTSKEAQKIEALMAAGPAEATKRLSANQLAEIKAHIGVIERLKFRCRRFLPPPPGAG